MRRLRAISLSASDRPLETLAELEAVMAAIRNQDPETARQACSHHVPGAKAALALLRQQLPTPPRRANAARLNRSMQDPGTRPRRPDGE